MRFLHLPKLTTDAEEKLQSAGDPYIWRQIKAGIEAGRSHLFVCPNDTYIVLAIVGDELIFIAAVGRDGVEIMQHAVNIARAKGLKGVRFQSSRKGMARLLKQFGPVELQTIYRIPV